jgi:hypothetical protein
LAAFVSTTSATGARFTNEADYKLVRHGIGADGINAKAQRRKVAKHRFENSNDFFAPSRLCVFALNFYAVATALAKNGLAAGAGGVTAAPAMKTLSAKAKIVALPSFYLHLFLM